MQVRVLRAQDDYLHCWPGSGRDKTHDALVYNVDLTIPLICACNGDIRKVLSTSEKNLPVRFWTVFNRTVVMASNFSCCASVSFPFLICNIECHSQCLFMRSFVLLDSAGNGFVIHFEQKEIHSYEIVRFSEVVNDKYEVIKWISFEDK